MKKKEIKNNTDNKVPNINKDGNNKFIRIKDASHHNLKHIDINIPRNKITLITGVSGSGKSTLAFDTLYAEGQRRFVESISSYARQFMERLPKPEVESIIGLPPAIAIEQKAPPKNPRSTVGTVTEIYDYIRALYARIGETHCINCGKVIEVDNPISISKEILEWNEGDKIYILFEIHNSIVNIAAELDRYTKLGFTRVVPKDANDIIDSNDLTISVKTKPEDYLVLVDRLIISKEKNDITRLIDSLEVAHYNNSSKIIIRNITRGIEERYSNAYECAECNIKYEEPEPKLFAFNNPKGACSHCQGIGQVFGFDENLVVPNKHLSINEECIHPYRMPSTAAVYKALLEMCAENNIPTNIPYNQLTTLQKELIWEGKGKYYGINKYFEFIEAKSYKIQNRMILSKYRGMARCIKCDGSRLKMSARQVFIEGKNIPEIVEMPINELYDFISQLELTEYQYHSSELILYELKSRIKMLLDIGLEYLTLSRSCQTLSGGEYQRINLSTALGSTLVGTLYVLDEPSIGMHPRDTNRLLNILYRLRNLGNTIVVVEHDPDIIAKADFIIDIGVGAGINGGHIISSGNFDDLLKSDDSLTAQYLNKVKRIEIPENRRTLSSKHLVIVGAKSNNLKIDRLAIPLNCLTVISGVSGSGKSTLINDILYCGLMEHFGQPIKDRQIGKYESIEGCDNINGIEFVDQTPIGKSSRSTPVTYNKVFESIRELYGQTQVAMQMGYKPGWFSFNVPGGRCDVCEGEGYVNIDMQFLPDVKVLCDACNGDRYKDEAKAILYRGKSIVDVLNMTVDEAIAHFAGISKIQSKLLAMKAVGLGYLKLGQASSTLSGGESQRIKLSSHIETTEHTNILYIFDEPTTGLHLDDISKLINALHQLIEIGNSVLIIEHNLNILSVADWIIDLGPEAGNNGGKVVGEGTPEQISQLNTHTGIALNQFLESEIK